MIDYTRLAKALFLGTVTIACFGFLFVMLFVTVTLIADVFGPWVIPIVCWIALATWAWYNALAD